MEAFVSHGMRSNEWSPGARTSGQHTQRSLREKNELSAHILDYRIVQRPFSPEIISGELIFVSRSLWSGFGCAADPESGYSILPVIPAAAAALLPAAAQLGVLSFLVTVGDHFLSGHFNPSRRPDKGSISSTLLYCVLLLSILCYSVHYSMSIIDSEVLVPTHPN